MSSSFLRSSLFFRLSSFFCYLHICFFCSIFGSSSFLESSSFWGGSYSFLGLFLFSRSSSKIAICHPLQSFCTKQGGSILLEIYWSYQLSEVLLNCVTMDTDTNTDTGLYDNTSCKTFSNFFLVFVPEMKRVSWQTGLYINNIMSDTYLTVSVA